MNLRNNVVATMCFLGLVSCPVFAATDTNTSMNDTSMVKHHRHHHHQKHHRMKHEPVVYHDYKDMGALPVQPAPEVCTISETAWIMDKETQSLHRSMPNPCNPGWFNRVQFSGGINVDLGKFGNRNGNYMGENYQRFSLNDAYLNMAAVITEYAKAFLSISYNTATINDEFEGFITGSHVAEYSSGYSSNVNGTALTALQIEQAYATFGNFDMSPFFIQVGKQFQDFSRYDIHPITRSLTQVISETLTTSGKVGFIVNGFSGSLFAFDDPVAKVGHGSKTTNYGLALGYEQPSDQIGFDLGAAYLYNMIGVNDVAYNVNQFTGGGYHTRVGAAAAYADLNSGPFIIGARYTTALQRFNILDLPKNGTGVASTTGAKPWAAGIQAAYGFEGWGRNQNIYAGYQASRQAVSLLLPKTRWLVGYNVNAFGRHTNIGLEWDNDRGYSKGNGGNGNNTNLVSVRTSVEFG